MLVSYHQLSHHGLIVGATGSGKTTSLLKFLCEAVVKGLPVIAIDLKGSQSFAQELYAASRIAGGRFSCGASTAPATGTRSPTATPPSSRTS